MNAIDLALAAGGAMTAGWGLLLIRRRRTRTRLDRLSRHRRATATRRRWPTTDRLAAVLVDRPGVAITAGSAIAGGTGLVAGGPVAAVLAVAYSAVGLAGIRRHLMRRAADRAVAELLDAIEDAVGDLRAGVVPYATAAPYPGGADVELYAGPVPVRPSDGVPVRPPGGSVSARPSGGRIGESGLGATVRRIWESADERGHRATATGTVTGRAVTGRAVTGRVVLSGAVLSGAVPSDALGGDALGDAVSGGAVDGGAVDGSAVDGGQTAGRSWVTGRSRVADDRRDGAGHREGAGRHGVEGRRDGADSHAGAGRDGADRREGADRRGGSDHRGAAHGGAAGPASWAGRDPAGKGGGRARRREDAAVSVALARLEAAHRVSEALGTPLADLLDQVEADLRAGQALRVNLAAQTSGAQTTSTLLVALPAGGLWLGAGIGVDPFGQLLHTPLGAACAITAVALQCAGLLWTGRMVRSVVAEVR